MATERIDVLAVMQEAAYGLALADERSYGAGDELLNARAAVAELIEAADKVQLAYALMNLDPDFIRLRKAIASCGGA